MNEKNTGGSAFPSLNAEMTGIDSEGNERFSVEPSGGMNLRDYFAAKIVSAEVVGSPKERAKWAYEVADAMLEERNK